MREFPSQSLSRPFRGPHRPCRPASGPHEAVSIVRCRQALAGGIRCRALSGQRGQALVLAVVLLFAGCLGLFFMFSTGQLAATRQRLDNAADASAYSAALWRARVMNYHAYSNRAIVAQEVAIAQAVTLVSWARYFDQFTGNASSLSVAFPPVAAVLQTGAQLAHAAAVVAEEAASEEIPARDTYKTLLAASQEVLQASVDTFGLGAVANEVARATDRRFFAFALPDGGEFSRMTRRYQDEERARLRGVVDQALDDFVKGPRGLDLTLLPMPSACFGNPFAGVGAWFHELLKRGGTRMAPQFERWEAADTLSIHGWWPSYGWFHLFKGCNRSEALPLGWGAAQADAGASGGTLLSDPGHVSDNPTAASLAQADIGGSGLRGSRPTPARPQYVNWPTTSWPTRVFRRAVLRYWHGWAGMTRAAPTR